MTDNAPQRLARYQTRVHASNRHAALGVPVAVLAANRQEAVDRAIDVGWSGHRQAPAERTRQAMQQYLDAGVTHVNVKQVLGLLSPTWPDGNYCATRIEGGADDE